jgi:hypothetical protein
MPRRTVRRRNQNNRDNTENAVNQIQYNLSDAHLQLLNLQNPTTFTAIVKALWSKFRVLQLQYPNDNRVIRVNDELNTFFNFSPEKLQVINNNQRARTQENTTEANEGLHLYNLYKYVNAVIRPFQVRPPGDQPEVVPNVQAQAVQTQEVQAQDVQTQDVQTQDGFTLAEQSTTQSDIQSAIDAVERANRVIVEMLPQLELGIARLEPGHRSSVDCVVDSLQDVIRHMNNALYYLRITAVHLPEL